MMVMIYMCERERQRKHGKMLTFGEFDEEIQKITKKLTVIIFEVTSKGKVKTILRALPDTYRTKISGEFAF